MHLPKWSHVRIPALALACILFVLKLATRQQSHVNENLALKVYERQNPGRHLHRYKPDKEYFKAQAAEAYKKFSVVTDGPVPKSYEEIEVDASFRRRIPPKPVARIRPIEVQTSLYFMADDGRYDAQQVIRCAHDKHYRLNKSSTCATSEQFRSKPYNLTFWTMDYSSGTVADIKLLLEPMGVRFIDKSLSPNCNVFETCSRNIPGIDSLKGLLLNKETAEQFQSEHLQDKEFMSADVFLCVRPAAMCELYRPFSKSMIINADTRYEFARWDMERWLQWNDNLDKMNKDPNNLISATSQYDVEYMRYYTGIAPTLLRPHCGYIKHSYSPQTTTNFLLAPIKVHETSFQQHVLQEFNQYSGSENATAILTSMSKFRFDQSAENIVRYAGIVLIPHQVASLRMTEFYRMNIPLFIPSLELLTRWQVHYGVITQMTWDHIAKYVHPTSLMSMPGRLSIPNPNDDRNKDSVGFWLNFTDFYSWPHIIRFYSMQDLVIKMEEYGKDGKLAEVSRKMAAYNKEVKNQIKRRWMQILDNLQTKKNRKLNHGH